MEKPEVTTGASDGPEQQPATNAGQTTRQRKSWIEVLVDPRTLQGLMSCGAGLLLLGLVTWLWAIGVFENKLVVAISLGVANFGMLALGVAGARYSRYQTASRAVTMLACLVMPLNLWFYDAQGLITLDQGGHLWVPALVCCAVYVLVARLLADPLFVNAIVGGVTLTGLLILADHNVDRLWEIIAPSSFLVILGIICIHFERIFPPEEGPFSRKNFGRAFFDAGHFVMGLGLSVLLVGRVAGRLYEELFVNVDWFAKPEVATQANLKLIAIGLVLSATYTYVYSQLVVQAKRRYLGLVLMTLAWAAILVLDVLQVSLTLEFLMLLAASTSLVASALVRINGKPSEEQITGGTIRPLAALVNTVNAGWLKGLNFVTLALGLAIWCSNRLELFGLVATGQFGLAFVVAALIGTAAWMLATLSDHRIDSNAARTGNLQGGLVLLWLAMDGLIALLGIELSVSILLLEMLLPLGLAVGTLVATNQDRRYLFARSAETLGTAILLVGVAGTLDMLAGVQFHASHLGLATFFAAASGCLGLSSRVTARLIPAGLAAISLCGATWQLFLGLGVVEHVFVHAITVIGLVLLVVSRFTQKEGTTASQLSVVSTWTGRLCISTAGAATLLIALSRLVSVEVNWSLLGLLFAQILAGSLAAMLSKQSTWRRHFWTLAVGQVLMTLLAYNTLSALSFWQRGEILLTCIGLVALALGYLGWSRETDQENDLVSFNLAIGSFLSAMPLTIGMLVQRFDNEVAEWGWRIAHEAGVLSVGLLLLGAGVLCRIRWSTIVGGSTVLIYVVSLVGLIRVPEQLQTTAIYMMVGGGLFFGSAVLLSMYRDRLLSIPDKIQSGEGVFRVLKWR